MRMPLSKKIAKVIACALILSIPTIAFSQDKVTAHVRLILRKSKADDAKIVLYKDGKLTEAKPVQRAGKFKVDLDYGADYVLSFEKSGYVTKKIAINTIVPESFPKNQENVIDFEVELFPQVDGVNLMVYNNPVGKIRFSSDVNDFDYDPTTPILFRNNRTSLRRI